MPVSKTAKRMLEKGYKYCQSCHAWRKPCRGCYKCSTCGYSTWKHYPLYIPLEDK